MRHAKTPLLLALSSLLLSALAFSSSSCAHRPAAEAPGMEAREPDPYSATFVYSHRPGGNRGLQPNQLFTLDVARRGRDRRYVFNFGGRQLVYLEGPQRHYLIAPECRQYVDATLESMNFRIPSSMAPEELVARLAGARDYRPLGEEPLAGRAALKYAPATTTPSGDEQLLYLDKETGLPLRVEVISQVPSPTKGREAETSHGNLPVIVEVREIKTAADPALFEVPAEMSEVPPSQLCPQVSDLAATAMQRLWSLSDQGAAR